jgi:hypothetical protein
VTGTGSGDDIREKGWGPLLKGFVQDRWQYGARMVIMVTGEAERPRRAKWQFRDRKQNIVFRQAAFGAGFPQSIRY